LQSHKQYLESLIIMKLNKEKWDKILCAYYSKYYDSMCKHTFNGGYFEKGAWPWASSNAVMPNDQMSALQD